MIVADQKPIEEIADYVKNAHKIMVVGCGGCVTVCLSGGQNEAEVMAATLRIKRGVEGEKLPQIDSITIERQCDQEYVDTLANKLEGVDAIISLACGVGVQFLAERYRDKLVVPAQNTKFIGGTKEHGVWEERCGLCGDCILADTGGICPIIRCSKSILNGPCGGSSDGKCEVDASIPCAWVEIYEHLKELGREDSLTELVVVKDWSKARDGGPRKSIREDVRL
jgi:ferredoxin